MVVKNFYTDLTDVEVEKFQDVAFAHDRYITDIIKNEYKDIISEIEDKMLSGEYSPEEYVKLGKQVTQIINDNMKETVKNNGKDFINVLDDMFGEYDLISSEVYILIEE